MTSRGGVFVGLGANLGDRDATLLRALALLDAEDGIEVLKVSTFHRTEPWRVEGQPDFLNAVAEIATELAPLALVERLLAVERELGRDRAGSERWAARTIDLDLLLFRDRVVQDEGCRVPHPHLHEREFALRPLIEIAPGIEIPQRGSAIDCLRHIESARSRASEPVPA